ncbi:MAG TPA: HAMP domain-containing protein [Roseiflexaceae bacterium]|nr:HAMP domain-containing protein [Roseiflexaceae bacterium]
MHVSISQRIATGLLLMISLIVALILVNTASVNAYRENALVLSSETLPQSKLLHDLEVQENRLLSEALKFLLTSETDHLEHYTDANAAIHTVLSQLHESAATDNVGQEEEQADIETIVTTIDEVIAFTDELLARHQRGETVDVAQISEQLDQRAEQTDEAIEDLADKLEAESQQVVATTQTNPLFITQLLGAIALAISIALFVVLVQTVVRPLRTLREATLAVAGGDLSRQVEAKWRDEIGDLASAFNQMVVQIAGQRAALQSQVELAEAARTAAQSAQASSAEQLATIEQQQRMIRNMSVPILPLSTEALIMPLIGALDGERLLLLQEQALQTLEQTRARFLILDLTGVPIVDHQIANDVIELIQAARLLGAEVVIVGIRPEVAQALVALSIDLKGIASFSTLQGGMQYVQQHETVARAATQREYRHG